LYCCCWTRSDVNAACGQLALDGKKEEAKQKAKKARVIQKKLAEEERERLLAEMRDEEDSSLFMDERGPLSFASMPTIARCADSKHGMVGGEGACCGGEEEACRGNGEGGCPACNPSAAPTAPLTSPPISSANGDIEDIALASPSKPSSLSNLSNISAARRRKMRKADSKEGSGGNGQAFLAKAADDAQTPAPRPKQVNGTKSMLVQLGLFIVCLLLLFANGYYWFIYR